MGAEIPDGAVLVARAIMNSSLWEMRPADRIVALTCMALCNKRPRKWFDGFQQIVIDAGQFVGSIRKMIRACKLPMQVVRTSLEHLEETEFLTRKSTQGYTLYTVPKFLHYQDLTKYSDSGVRKPTQVLTRDQHTQNGKINTLFPQSLHKEKNGKGLSESGFHKPVDPMGTLPSKNQHTKNGKTNNKQQQHIPPSFSDPSSSERTEGGGEGIAVVVTSSRESNDPILTKTSFRISSDLLLSIGMSQSCANSFASSKPVGQVLRAVQHARLQKKPGGWARTALENDWRLPEIPGQELREIIEKVKRDVDQANAFFLKKAQESGVKAKLPARLQGEDERAWMRRVSDEIARRRQEPKPTGPKKRKG